MNKKILGVAMALLPLTTISTPKTISSNDFYNHSKQFRTVTEDAKYNVTDNYQIDKPYYFKMKQINCGIGHHFYYKFTGMEYFGKEVLAKYCDYTAPNAFKMTTKDFINESIYSTSMSFYVENKWDVKNFDNDIKKYNDNGKKNIPLSIELHDKIANQLKLPSYKRETSGDKFTNLFDKKGLNYYTKYNVTKKNETYTLNQKAISKKPWAIGLVGDVYVLSGRFYLTKDTWRDHAKYEGYDVNFKVLIVQNTFLDVVYNDGTFFKE